MLRGAADAVRLGKLGRLDPPCVDRDRPCPLKPVALDSGEVDRCQTFVEIADQAGIAFLQSPRLALVEKLVDHRYRVRGLCGVLLGLDSALGVA